MKKIVFIIALSSVSSPALSADVVTGFEPNKMSMGTILGRAVAEDGRSLYFPQQNTLLRLSDIDACDTPQWSLSPKWNDRDKVKAPAPVPCGAFAKAWLKQAVDGKMISCNQEYVGQDGVVRGQCFITKVRGKSAPDLAQEMLFAGWAKVADEVKFHFNYYQIQEDAMKKRRGMWETYVLDMNEWRSRAIDKTNSRQPIADYNLLKSRHSEISPPFKDAKKRPVRTDR